MVGNPFSDPHLHFVGNSHGKGETVGFDDEYFLARNKCSHPNDDVSAERTRHRNGQLELGICYNKYPVDHSIVMVPVAIRQT